MTRSFTLCTERSLPEANRSFKKPGVIQLLTLSSEVLESQKLLFLTPPLWSSAISFQYTIFSLYFKERPNITRLATRSISLPHVCGLYIYISISGSAPCIVSCNLQSQHSIQKRKSRNTFSFALGKLKTAVLRPEHFEI